MALGFACQGYVIYFFITWFPTYLVNELHFSMLKLGLWGTVPGLTAFAGNFLGGYVSDRLLRAHTLTYARKACIIAGMLLSTVIGLSGFVHSPELAVLLLSLSFAGVTFATTSIVALPADIAPRTGPSIAGSIQGFQNGVSNLGGIACPLIVGRIYSMTGSFRWGMASAALVAVVGCLLYAFVVQDIRPVTEGEFTKD